MTRKLENKRLKFYFDKRKEELKLVFFLFNFSDLFLKKAFHSSAFS